jgi:hypothetical protein
LSVIVNNSTEEAHKVGTGALEVIPETQSEAVEEPKKMSHSSLFFNDQIIFEKSFGSNDVIKDEEYKDREQIDFGGHNMHNTGDIL